MNQILEFYARTRRPYLHATGVRATGLLLDELAARKEGKILELGFGTGQTLVDLAARHPGFELYGVERSAKMLAAAQKRLAFCQVNGIRLSLLQSETALPFPDHFFSAVYAESVLAFLPGDSIPLILSEVFRVLEPGGLLLLNESLWREHITPETQRAINRQCIRLFGIPQANERFPFPEDWVSLCLHTGFLVERIWPLANTPNALVFKPNLKLLLAKIYTLSGKLRSLLYPALRRQSAQFRQAEREFEQYGLFLAGFLFKIRKPGKNPS
ncbi:MAG: methyltransferase domain-containing protein [Lewinellaceae bacterium]|nr:methyltransferase domain-containing protein [Lewinellaceae bacterium]